MMRRRWRKKRTGFGAAVGFLREYEQKKTGTTRGSVTVNHDAVGSSPTGGATLDKGEPLKKFAFVYFLSRKTRIWNHT